MRRTLLLAALALAALIAGLYFGRSRDGEMPTTRVVAPAPIVPRAIDPKTGARVEIPAWFAQRGAGSRKVAGLVTYDGKPAAGVEVRLTSQLTEAGFAAEQTVKTDASGAFDFGAQPAAQLVVSASAPERTAATVAVDLRDPMTKSDHLELRLGHCDATLSGRVLDASANAIGKARVTVNGGRSETDATGSYHLCVGFGTQMLLAEADGYGSIDLLVFVLGNTRRDVVLVPEAVVSGRVVRAEDGAPVPHAQVWIWPQPQSGGDGPHSVSAIADPAGHFRAAGLNPGEVAVSALAEGLASSGIVRASAAAGQANPEVVVRLSATARISGKVVMAGKPVAGARLRTTLRTPTRYSPEVVTQRDGSFVLDRVWRGDNVPSIFPYEVVSPKAIDVRGDREGVVIEVADLASVRGRVLRRGVPLAGADVSLAGGGTRRELRTENDGSYEVKGLRPGTVAIQAQSGDRTAFAHPTQVVLAAGEHRSGVDIELNFAGAIAGTVVDQDGKPVEGVYVRWVQPSGDEGLSQTDAAGAYLCGAMTGGADYKASVRATLNVGKPLPWAQAAPPAVHVADGDTRVDGVQLAVRYDRLAITGHVVDQQGNPLVDVRVRAEPATGNGEPQFSTWLQLPSALTDGDGAFSLTGLAAGTYGLEARAPDGSDGVVTGIAAGATGVKVTVLRAGAIDGTLVGFGAEPVVYAQRAGDQRFVGAQVDGQTFHVGGLGPGAYTVTAQTQTEGDATRVDLAPGATTQVTLTSHGHATITGTVVAFGSGTPVPGDHVCRAILRVDSTAGLTNWDPATLPHTDAQGHFALDPAPAGNVMVTCYDFTGAASSGGAVLSLAAGARTDLKIPVVTRTDVTGDFGSAGFGLDFNAGLGGRILSVTPDSAAAHAGFLPGDAVTTIDGAQVGALTPDGVLYLIGNHPIGSTIAVTVTHAKGGTASATLPVLGE